MSTKEMAQNEFGTITLEPAPPANGSGNLMFALFAFVVYFNLTSVGVNWISSGRVPFGTFMLSLHGGTLACGTLWLIVRHNQLSWRMLLPRPSRQPTVEPS